MVQAGDIGNTSTGDIGNTFYGAYALENNRTYDGKRTIHHAGPDGSLQHQRALQRLRDQSKDRAQVFEAL